MQLFLQAFAKVRNGICDSEKTQSLLSQIFRPTPRRSEKDNFSCDQFGDNVKEVAHDELDSIGDTVDLGIVTRVLDLDGVDVDGNHTFASERKL